MFTFFGLFTDSLVALRPQLLQRWPGTDVVQLTSPFMGIAARFSEKTYVPADEDLPASVSDEIKHLSLSYFGVGFLLLRTECWGGDCFNWGQLIRDGEITYETNGAEALRRLILQFGVDIGPKEIFAPLSRAFPWKDATR